MKPSSSCPGTRTLRHSGRDKGSRLCHHCPAWIIATFHASSPPVAHTSETFRSHLCLTEHAVSRCMQFMLSLSRLVQHCFSASTVPRVPIALPSETNGRRPVLPCLPTVKRAQRSRRSTLAYPRTCSMTGAALLEPIGNVSVAGCHRTVPELSREAQGQPT